MDDLVTTHWLAGEPGAPDLRILDATYFALEPTRDARAAFEAGHIPGAAFLNLEQLADPHASLPGSVPSVAQAQARLSALGVSRDDRIVVYDGAPHHSAMRAWWLLRLFGARHVAVLDGGWAAWVAEGRAVATGPVVPVAGHFEAVLHPATLRTIEQLRVASDEVQLVDARSAARFAGTEPEPRAGVAPGHIPGSRNLPYGALFAADGRLSEDAVLARLFADAGIDRARPIVTTCGSGITAAILLFALHRLGARDLALYDGSWSEWGADPATAKAIGPA